MGLSTYVSDIFESNPFKDIKWSLFYGSKGEFSQGRTISGSSKNLSVI